MAGRFARRSPTPETDHSPSNARRGSSMASNACAGTGTGSPRSCSTCACPTARGSRPSNRSGWRRRTSRSSSSARRMTKTSPPKRSSAEHKTMSGGTASTAIRCRGPSSGSSSDKRRKRRCSSSSSARTSRLNSIGDAVLSTDVPGSVTYLNPVAERMTGWTAPGGVGPADRRGVPDHRRDDTPARAQPDGPGDADRQDRRPDPELPPRRARRARDGHRRLRLPHPRSAQGR